MQNRLSPVAMFLGIVSVMGEPPSVDDAKSVAPKRVSYLLKIASPPTTQALNSSHLPCILRGSLYE